MSAAAPDIWWFVFASIRGVGHTRIPFGKSKLKLADRERLGDRHLVLGLFIAPPLSLISWRTHHELAGRDHNHLGALRAVLEGVLRLQAALFAANERRDAITLG